MRFTSKTQGMDVHILLDSESYNNFLQPRINHYLKLLIELAHSLQVIVGMVMQC